MKNNNFFISKTFIIVIFAIVAIMTLLDVFNVPSNIGIIKSPIELNPWVELAITCLFVIFSAVITIHSVVLSIKNQEAQRKEDNEKAVLPMGKIVPLNETDRRKEEVAIVTVDAKYTKTKKIEIVNSYKFLYFKLRNVGQREMYSIKLSFTDNDNFELSPLQDIAPIIYSNDEAIIAIRIITKRPKTTDKMTLEDIGGGMVHPITPIEFAIEFNDCYHNKYKQSFQVETEYSWMKIRETRVSFRDYENPKLAGFKVLSAPEKI